MFRKFRLVSHASKSIIETCTDTMYGMMKIKIVFIVQIIFYQWILVESLTLVKIKKTQIMKNAFIVNENKIDARLFLFLFLFNTFLFNIYVANIYASSLKSTMQFSVACLSPIIGNNKNKINIKFVNRKTIILIHSLILITS